MLPMQIGALHKKEYSAWKAMRQRCSNKKSSSYHLYGGKGISVCKRWNKFDTFLKDLGPAPSKKHSLDRIDSNKNYMPSNCRWATAEEQANNTSRNVFYIIGGIKKSLPQWCRGYNINFSTVRHRLECGWTIEKALTYPTSDRRITTGKSGVHGATIVRGKFVVRIKHKGKTFNLGNFTNSKDADLAYKSALKKIRESRGLI